MRTIFFIFSFIFTFSANSQEKQQFLFTKQIIYRLTYQPDSTDEGYRPEENMELLINDSISLFRSLAKGILDSIDYLRETRPSNTIQVTSPYSDFQYQIIKEGDSVKVFDVYDSEFMYNGENDFYYLEKRGMSWELTDDTLTINGLPCQKARLNFGNRRWIAWFTTEIPIQDGPYKFSGLPGLIVKVHDVKEHWQFDLVQVKNVSKEVVVNFKRNRRPSLAIKEEFFENKRYYRLNRLELQELEGDISFPSSEDRMIIKKNIDEANKKDNNWIELYY